jgi:hypothetical protein
MKRFPLTNPNSYSSKYRHGEKLYATLELNQVAFPKTGMVVSQVPLGEEFTIDSPCENGMWLIADKAAKAINSISATINQPVGIVYTTEKEYDDNHYGLQTFGRKIAGDYPRVGILGIGDTVTTNCLQYDDEEEFAAVTTTGKEKTSDQVLFDALDDIDAHPLYVVPVVGSGVPQITATKPQSGIYAKVVKFYTVPNGERGVKYQVIRV